MTKIGFIYSTVDGHTVTICKRLAMLAEERGLQAALVELTPDSPIDLKAFDQVVIGASIRYGKHRPEVTRFVKNNGEALTALRGCFFSVNAVARKPDKRQADTNPYVRKFLASVDWQPAVIGIFAGRINYSMYGFWDRTMIRIIMRMTNGPTALDSDVDFTDWGDVEDFAEGVFQQGRA